MPEFTRAAQDLPLPEAVGEEPVRWRGRLSSYRYGGVHERWIEAMVNGYVLSVHDRTPTRVGWYWEADPAKLATVPDELGLGRHILVDPEPELDDGNGFADSQEEAKAEAVAWARSRPARTHPTGLPLPEAVTTFPNEVVKLECDGCTLVQVDDMRSHRKGQRMWVAVSADGNNTDYPYLHGGRAFWDNPEWFTEKFRRRTARIMRNSQDLKQPLPLPEGFASLLDGAGGPDMTCRSS
jgi:hypothetical protein